MRWNSIVDVIEKNELTANLCTLYAFLLYDDKTNDYDEIDQWLTNKFASCDETTQKNIINVFINPMEMMDILSRLFNAEQLEIETRKIRFAMIESTMESFGDDIIQNYVSLSDCLDLFCDREDNPYLIRFHNEKDIIKSFKEITTWLGKERKALTIEQE